MSKHENDENISRALKILCHPRRIVIMRLLSDTKGSELCFRQLQLATGLKNNTLLHHLREMERGWLLSRQRKGNETFYCLTTDSLMHSTDLIHEILNARFRSSLAA